MIYPVAASIIDYAFCEITLVFVIRPTIIVQLLKQW